MITADMPVQIISDLDMSSSKLMIKPKRDIADPNNMKALRNLCSIGNSSSGPSNRLLNLCNSSFIKAIILYITIGKIKIFL